MRRLKIGMVVLCAMTILGIGLCHQFKQEIPNYYQKLARYKADTVMTRYGKLAYTTAGNSSNTAVCFIHGFNGGYDQGIDQLNQWLSDDYFKIAPSRFGYAGSDLPKNASVFDQSKQFIELLDALHIDQAVFIAQSAGAGAGYQLAIHYPERVKALIIVSGDAPYTEKTWFDKLGVFSGPPRWVLSDFSVWFFSKYFGWLTGKSSSELLENNLPMEPKREGAQFDGQVTNPDLYENYSDYPLEKIQCPVLSIAAKDDPFIPYDHVMDMVRRTHAKTIHYETGGHDLEGQAVGEDLKQFLKTLEK